MNFEGLTFEEVVNQYIQGYVADFGQIKATSITEKVITSNKISGLISTAGYTAVPLNAAIILNCINTIPFFIFSRGQTQALAGLLILWRWHNNVNITLALLNEERLKKEALEIITLCKATYA